MKRILRHLALLVVLGSALVVLEPTLASARIQTIRVGTRNVLVMIPRRRPLHESGYPLLVALHGAGGRAKRYLSSWREFHSRYRLVIALPQAETTRWRPADRGPVLALVKELRRRLRIDPRRIYLVGFSRGGTYTYHFGLRADSPFRAIAPFAAGFVLLNGEHQKTRVPVCLVHGGKDGAVKPGRTKKMVALLRERHQPFRLRLLAGVGHQHPDEANRWIWACLDRNFQLALARERRQRRKRGRKKRPPAGPNIVTVRRGDTLWKLARRYGATPTKLRELNRLKGETIRIGQRLRIR